MRFLDSASKLRAAALILILTLAGAINSAGASAPYAYTQSANYITSSNAVLNGFVTPNGEPTVAWFEWGLTAEYGNRTSLINAGDGTGVVFVTNRITSLVPGCDYHFRLVASNSAGIKCGAEQRFAFGKKVIAWGRNDYNQCVVPPGLSNVVAVAAGQYFSLALRSDNTTVGWGGLNLNYPWPPLSNVVAIAAGEDFSLTLMDDGTVQGWGNLAYAGSVPAGLSDIVAISAGMWHALALKRDGTVIAWGYDYLGLCDVPQRATNIVAVSAGRFSSTVLKNDGTVITWGDGGDAPPDLAEVVAISGAGALKSDGTVACWDRYGPMPPSGLSNVVAIAGAPLAALKEDGTAVVWGSESFTNVPADLRDVVAISPSWGHVVALGANQPPLANSQVVSGALNHDMTACLSGSDPNADALGFKISALPEKGTLYQFAESGRGEVISNVGTWITDRKGRVIFVPESDSFGDPYATFQFVANDGQDDSAPGTITITIESVPRAWTLPARMIASTNAVLAGMVLANGSAVSAWFDWGTDTSYGNRTDPLMVTGGNELRFVTNSVEALTPGETYHFRLVVSNRFGVSIGPDQLFAFGKKVAAWGFNRCGVCDLPAGLTNVVGIAAGYLHSILLRSDGTVVRWGDDYFDSTPAPLDLTNVVAVAAAAQTLALRIDGTVTAWGGDRHYGQNDVPAFVTNIVAIATGSSHSLGLKEDGKVVAWEFNDWGLNGYGETNVPSSLDKVVAIAAGAGHNVALRIDLKVVAWGRNEYGQSDVPVGLDTVQAVAAGSSHSLALKKDGTVVAWGANLRGQCNVPANLTNVVAITAAGETSSALRADGTVVVWGYYIGEVTNPPSGLTGSIAIDAGGNHMLALGANVPPNADSQRVSVGINTETTIVPLSTDANDDVLSFKITQLPARGALYQYENGMRGAPISATNTWISDPKGRVIFVSGDNATPGESAFEFMANDGLADSAPGVVTVNLETVPRASTFPATEIRPFSAVLNGMATPRGSPSVAWFEWGNSTAYGHRTDPINVGQGDAVVFVTNRIEGLTRGHTYHFRLVVSNSFGCGYGKDQVFASARRLFVSSSEDYPLAQRLSDIVAVSDGLALTVEGNVVALGTNMWDAWPPSGSSNIAAISSGQFGGRLALRNDGTLIQGSYHEESRALPSNVVSIATGSSHCLALKRDGTVVAWGDNWYGETNVPLGLKNVVGVAISSYSDADYSFAVKNDGSVVAWGGGVQGLVPLPEELTNIVAIAAKSKDCVALKRDGTVFAWNLNRFGDSITPPDGLSSVTAVAAGFFFGLALKSDGTVVSFPDHYSVAPPWMSISNVVAIAAGSSSALMLVADQPPVTLNQTVNTTANTDVVMQLAGTDCDGEPVFLRIGSLPNAGMLYQYGPWGGRGDAIQTNGTPVYDWAGRVVFAPASNSFGLPYASFQFIGSDRFADSVPGTVTVNIARPDFLIGNRGFAADKSSFRLSFSGLTNSSYSAYASSNLIDWMPIGYAVQTVPGCFQVDDTSITNHPKRFYQLRWP